MTRILTAAVLIPLVVYVIFGGHQILFLAVTCLVAVLCYREYSDIADTHGLETDSPLAYAAGLVIVIVPHLDPVIFVLLAMAMLVIAIRSGSLTITLMQASAVVMGVAYVFGAWRCAAGLRMINPHWLLYALALNWVGDIAAFYIGSRIGRHKLAPRISPGKSWEGAIASVVFSAVFGVVYLGRFIPEVPLWEAVLLTAAANAVGQLGDLSESALKRGAGLKESGNLLPGHGGWLDRVDSSLFSLPFVYFWLARSSMSL
ncbi:MAG: phosphatidate cytidylyltransferase [Acidobacteriia bacterium]|nr:phosphatidate cytidylyltransferase [Terriglobia bacterium]